MSLGRMAYYSAVIGGWGAFFAWMVCEYLFLSRAGNDAPWWHVVVAAAIVGGAIGAGLNAVAGMSNGGFQQTVKRLGPGFVGGTAGGAIGGLLGNVLFAYVGMPRVVGWIIMGMGIGVVEGVYENSPSKIRNGLIGGGLGGLLGGCLFDVLPAMIHSGSGMSSRATAFVILGLCIGALIGLVQVAMRDAWLTVMDGYRVGRQLILSSPVTILGRGDHLRLPFVGTSNSGLEIEHLAIERSSDGSFFVRDLSSKMGSFVNNIPVQGSVELMDGDTIKLGANLVRFNLRHRKPGDQRSQSPDLPQSPGAPKTKGVLPPPVRKASSNPNEVVGNATTTSAAPPAPVPVAHVPVVSAHEVATPTKPPAAARPVLPPPVLPKPSGLPPAKVPAPATSSVASAPPQAPTTPTLPKPPISKLPPPPPPPIKKK